MPILIQQVYRFIVIDQCAQKQTNPQLIIHVLKKLKLLQYIIYKEVYQLNELKLIRYKYLGFCEWIAQCSQKSKEQQTEPYLSKKIYSSIPQEMYLEIRLLFQSLFKINYVLGSKFQVQTKQLPLYTFTLLRYYIFAKFQEGQKYNQSLNQYLLHVVLEEKNGGQQRYELNSNDKQLTEQSINIYLILAQSTTYFYSFYKLSKSCQMICQNGQSVRMFASLMYNLFNDFYKQLWIQEVKKQVVKVGLYNYIKRTILVFRENSYEFYQNKLLLKQIFKDQKIVQQLLHMANFQDSFVNEGVKMLQIQKSMKHKIQKKKQINKQNNRSHIQKSPKNHIVQSKIITTKAQQDQQDQSSKYQKRDNKNQLLKKGHKLQNSNENNTNIQEFQSLQRATSKFCFNLNLNLNTDQERN